MDSFRRMQIILTHSCLHTVNNPSSITFLTHPMEACRSSKVLDMKDMLETVNHLRHTMAINGNNKVLGTSPFPEIVNHWENTSSKTLLTEICGNSKVLGTSPLPEMVNNLEDITSPTYPMDVCRSDKSLNTNSLPEMVNYLEDTTALTYRMQVYCSNKPEMVNHLGDTTSKTLQMEDLGNKKGLGTSTLREMRRSFPSQPNLPNLLLGRNGRQETADQASHFHGVDNRHIMKFFCFSNNGFFLAVCTQDKFFQTRSKALFQTNKQVDRKMYCYILLDRQLINNAIC